MRSHCWSIGSIFSCWESRYFGAGATPRDQVSYQQTRRGTLMPRSCAALLSHKHSTRPAPHCASRIRITALPYSCWCRSITRSHQDFAGDYSPENHPDNCDPSYSNLPHPLIWRTNPYSRCRDSETASLRRVTIRFADCMVGNHSIDHFIPSLQSAIGVSKRRKARRCSN